MKKIVTCFVLASLLAAPVFAQTVEKDLGTNGDWKGALILDHKLWKKNACLAFAKTGDAGSFLELYAEQAGETKGLFVEPTIQVVTKETGFVRGVLTDEDGEEKYQLTLASNQDQKPAQGLLARFAERKKLIDFLKRAANARVQLINSKGKLIKTLAFSLRGSTKSIDSVFSACKLAL